MSILCTLFGHQPPTQAATPAGEQAFLYCYSSFTDRLSFYVHGSCPRCRQIYIVANTHLSIPECHKLIHAAQNVEELFTLFDKHGIL